MEDLQGGALALEHRYDIGRPVGTIGFSSVYKGVQHPFGRDVTIVVFDVLAESGASEGLVARIRASAEAYARLEHAGVVRAIDVGELDANLPFVVVDRAPGTRLATHFDAVGTMSPDETVALVTRLAEILAEAHEKGVLHGSLAPAWVHVNPEEPAEVAVEHWGLGLTVDEIRSMDNAYMGFDAVCALPPEMFEGSPEPTIASDVFALAAIAYRALAGIHPFFDDLSDTSDGLLRLQREDARSLENYGVETELATVVARGLARDPDERWVTVEAFADALKLAARPPTQEADERESDEAESDSDEGLVEPATPIAVEPEDRTDFGYSQNVPSPKGGLAAAAIALLLVTNIGWYLFKPFEVQAEGNPAPSEVLPDGVQLVSSPAGAKVIEIRGENETELGETPVMIDPKIRDTKQMDLKLIKRGFLEQRVQIRRSDQGNDVVIELTESN